VTPEREPSTKVDLELAVRLQLAPGGRHAVDVWFTELPPTEALAALGLVRTSTDRALGQLDASQVGALAERPDVERLELRAEPRLH
jgi:hypothetical protein